MDVRGATHIQKPETCHTRCSCALSLNHRTIRFAFRKQEFVGYQFESYRGMARHKSPVKVPSRRMLGFWVRTFCPFRGRGRRIKQMPGPTSGQRLVSLHLYTLAIHLNLASGGQLMGKRRRVIMEPTAAYLFSVHLLNWNNSRRPRTSRHQYHVALYAHFIRVVFTSPIAASPS